MFMPLASVRLIVWTVAGLACSTEPREAPQDAASAAPAFRVDTIRRETWHTDPDITVLTLHSVSASRLEEMSRFAQSREPQLRFCYHERGLQRDSTLTGDLALQLQVTATGRIEDLQTLRRVWVGADSAAVATETCIRQKVLSWRWPAGGPDQFELRAHFSSHIKYGTKFSGHAERRTRYQQPNER
jgi:hypothetical protein